MFTISHPGVSYGAASIFWTKLFKHLLTFSSQDLTLLWLLSYKSRLTLTATPHQALSDFQTDHFSIKGFFFHPDLHVSIHRLDALLRNKLLLTVEPAKISPFVLIVYLRTALHASLLPVKSQAKYIIAYVYDIRRLLQRNTWSPSYCFILTTNGV